MSPNDIINLAKKRLKNSSALIDWNTLYGIIVDEIFTRKQWKFAQLASAYIQLAGVSLKTFSGYNTGATCTTNGTTLLTSAGLFVPPILPGQTITGEFIPLGTTVSVITDASNITMSLAATGSSTKTRNFIGDPTTELSVNKLKSFTYSMDFTGGGTAANPFIIAKGSVRPIEYIPIQKYNETIPDGVNSATLGNPQFYSIVKDNDGTNGLEIVIWPAPSANIVVGWSADCTPSYIINSSPMPILPVQFHRLVFYGLVMQAADEVGMDKLSAKAEKWFEAGIARMDIWDTKNPKYYVGRKSYEDIYPYSNKGPYFPGNFPYPYGR